MKEKKLIFGLIFVTLIMLHIYSTINSTGHNNTSSIINATTNSSSANELVVLENNKTINSKRILFWGTLYGASTLVDYCIEKSSMDFCPFKCQYTVNQNLLNSSDAVVIHGREQIEMQLPSIRTPNQRWVFLMFESPDNSWTSLSDWNNIFNWTMSYRNDADIPIPYGRLFRRPKKEQLSLQKINFSLPLQYLSKKKPIAWAASNCAFVTSGRKELVDEISKHISVDVYGKCGQYDCIKGHQTTSDQCSNPYKCHEYLGSKYKFYLAFENSLCQEYITEKFFNSLKYGMVPVVHGPPKEFYLQLAPEGSFIHVTDFPSIKQLAEHLLFLDQNSTEYLKYFEWKKYYTLDRVYYFHRAWCNLCEKLHTAPEADKNVYPSIDDWWFYKNDPIVQGQPCHKANITDPGVLLILKK